MIAAMAEHVIQTNNTLADVKYEIRGQLAHRAYELEKRGYEILSLNIGNPGLSGFRTPGPEVIMDVFSRIESLLEQHVE